MNAQSKQTAIKIGEGFERLKKTIGIILFIIISLSLIGSVLYSGYSAYKYVGDHNFLWRSPVEIKLQTPLNIVKKREVVLNEVKTQLRANKSDISVSAKEVQGSNEGGVITAGESLDEKLERYYDGIWLHESERGENTKGANGYCIDNGLGINEVGYAPKDLYCFKDRKEQKDTVKLWFTNRLGKDCVKQGFCFDTVEEGLRIYNSNSYTL